MSRLFVITVFIFGLIGLASSMILAGDPPKGLPANPSRGEILDHLLKLKPAERMRLLTKVLDQGKDFLPVDRGPVVATIVERGSLQAVQTSDVFCRVRAAGTGGKDPAFATSIKWIIDDGTMVKKGDRLIEFDDSAHSDLLRKQKSAAAKADAEEKAAAENLERIKKEHQIDVKLAQIDVRLAELALKQYKGADAVQKDILALQVDRAELLVDRIRLRGPIKQREAADELESKKKISEQELGQERDLEKVIANCVVTAPQDGMSVYYIPEQARFGGGQQGTVAQGEPVREGQKLMMISDLKRMAVTARVHEAVIAKVRGTRRSVEGKILSDGQTVSVRVDAFPDRVYAGKVQEVGVVPLQADFLSSDVKLYPVTIALDSENKSLKPGMSAEVTILVDKNLNCLRLPASAVLGRGKDRYCYVLTGKELHKRELVIGLTDGKTVEIGDGLKEGEMVLRHPHAVAARLADSFKPDEKRDASRLKPTQIQVHSVKPADDDGLRTRVSTFGLTHKDYDGIAELDFVSALTPVRSFPCEVRRNAGLSVAQLVATTKDYADTLGLKLAGGRFLSAEDDESARNVAVIGADVADTLCRGEDPLGQTVIINKHAYVIVGVLRDVRPGGISAEKLDGSVFIPLNTCKQRFGERVLIRQSSRFRVEAVQLHEILVTVRDASRIRATVAAIGALLEKSHPRRDWALQIAQK